ncbi:hypothetical protein EV122DRAFT_225333, partial [Schizophyllum commune]
PTLRARLIAFGDALLAASPPVAGLDKSIIIDPRRVHLTLGVMRLEEEEDSAPTGTAHADTEAQAIGDPPSSPPPPKKTISSALALLRSLAPQLAALGPARIDLERLGVLKTQKGGREANVLWVGPREADDSLYAIADLVHQTFHREGYVTETRPLKLHVTLLNTTHRKKPRRRLAFSYTDVLQSEAVKLLVGLNSHPTASSAHSTSSTARPSSAVPRHPIPISLGSYDVRAVHLCEMGSHGPDNEYVSIGCVEF